MSAASSHRVHVLQNVSLTLLSLLFLPLDTVILFLAYASNFLVVSKAQRRRNVATHASGFRPKNILVTGVGMSKGLDLARIFYEAGHNVVGADFETTGALVCGRFSRTLSKFYALERPDAKRGSAPYIQGLLSIVLEESVDLWVSCSGVASAVEDGEAKEILEARTSCKAIQFDAATTQLLHEKHSFVEHTRKIGLPMPETHTITEPEAAEKILLNASGRKYIIKPIGVDDANRGDMTLLPKSTDEETSRHLAQFRISEQSPWILQQFVDGPEYCTHSLVVNGVVKAFVACPSAELLMHYEALPPASRLSQKMLEFTRAFAADQGRGFTGHLSFDFLLHDNEGLEPVLLPIECNPRAHTAVVLFHGSSQLAEVFLSTLETSDVTVPDSMIKKSSTPAISHPVVPQEDHKYYWAGHDMVTLVLLPVLSLLTFQRGASLIQVFRGSLTFIKHLLLWRDGTFERWDPAPWWWLYHVYWPMQFWLALRTGQKWSRINVSTTKMFLC